VGATTRNTGAFTTVSATGGIAGTAGLNISGAGWGVLPYVANSFVVDNNSGQTRFFATGADATTDGSFLFYTSQTDGGANERMRIDSSGNLGIGTSSPSYKLDVNGSGNIFRIINSSTSSALMLATNSGASSILVLGNESTTAGSSATGSASYAGLLFTTGAKPLQLGTNSVIQATIDTSGNLGLGVTPSAWGSSWRSLDMFGWGSVASASDNMNVFNNTYNNGTNFIYKNTGFASRYAQSGGVHYWFNAPSGTAGNAITFTQAMTLDASGKLGVGAPSPGAKLDVVAGAFVDVNARISTGASTVGNYARLTFSENAGATTLGWVNSWGSAMGAGLDSGMEVWNNRNSFLRFGTNNTERARIDSSGNLLVGTTTATGNATGSSVNPGIVIASLGTITSQANGNANQYWSKAAGYTSSDFTAHYANSSYVGGISTNGSTTTYAVASDYRLKENVQPMTGALAKVAQLKPVTYTWKASGLSTQGFIAHELQSVVPDCVVGEKDALNADGSIKPQGIDTSFLVATLTAAIQEQQALIQDLTTRLAALEAK
jgi:hypothetical protein